MHAHLCMDMNRHTWIRIDLVWKVLSFTWNVFYTESHVWFLRNCDNLDEFGYEQKRSWVRTQRGVCTYAWDRKHSVASKTQKYAVCAQVCVYVHVCVCANACDEEMCNGCTYACRMMSAWKRQAVCQYLFHRRKIDSMALRSSDYRTQMLRRERNAFAHDLEPRTYTQRGVCASSFGIQRCASLQNWKDNSNHLS